MMWYRECNSVLDAVREVFDLVWTEWKHFERNCFLAERNSND